MPNRDYMILAVDFDGTCVENAFPEVGEPIEGAVDALKQLTDLGHKIIVWTCREDHPKRLIDKAYLTHAVKWFEENDIPLAGINETPLDDEFRDFENALRRKAYADYYIDDRNIGGFLGWKKILELLLNDDGDKVFYEEDE